VFSEEQLAGLADSIQRHGLLQPVIVRRLTPDRYEIVAGERRWRAAQKAGLTAIDAIVHDVADREALTLALVENLQREDLGPIEEALAYDRLHRVFGFSHSQIAEAVGKDRSTIANAIRLLKLPESVQQAVLRGALSMGHARALLTLEDHLAMERLAREIERKGLSVRQAERLAAERRIKHDKAAPGDRDSDSGEGIGTTLSQVLGTKVEIRTNRRGGGAIVVHYASREELVRLVERLSC
jgi:ParB family chromosome partitioning protein